MISSLFLILIVLVVALIILSVANYAINKSMIPPEWKWIVWLLVLLAVLLVIGAYFFGNKVITL